MKFFLSCLVLVSIFFSSPSKAATPPAENKSLDCKIGPIDKIFGKTPWIVYSCIDQKTIVVVTGPNNPASPFVFILSEKHGEPQVYGEGTGRKDLTDAAYADLLNLTKENIRSIILETKSIQK